MAAPDTVAPVAPTSPGVLDRLASQPLATAALALLGLLLGRELVEFASAWESSAESSHGFLVLPGFLYLVWRKRALLAAAGARPCPPAALLLAGALLLFAVGKQSGLPSFYRTAVVAFVVATAFWLFGRAAVRQLFWPFVFLCFIIPPPRVFLTAVSLPLRRTATELSCAAAGLLGIPLTYAGTTVTLPAGTLEIEAACSGLRGAITLVVIAIFLGELRGAGMLPRLGLVGASLGLAFVLNILRLILTILFVHVAGLGTATTSFHEAMGLAIIVVGAVTLSLIPAGRRAATEAAP
jgi:exosortase